MANNQENPLIKLLMDAMNSEAVGAAELRNAEMLPTNMGDRKAYEAMGIVFGNVVEGDNLFIHCTLPLRWEKVQCEHDGRHMHLNDENGRKRAHIFYKNAFGDRVAYMTITRRISMEIDYSESNFGVAIVSDGETQLYRTSEYAPNVAETIHNARDKAEADATEWLNTNLPDWQEATAYWDTPDLNTLLKK